MPSGANWLIVFYEASSGRQPVQEIIRILEINTKSKIARGINLLAAYGPSIGMPHSKRLTQAISELRIRGTTDVRILYGFADRTIYFLHIFKKKSQQTPQREITIAEARWRELNS